MSENVSGKEQAGAAGGKGKRRPVATKEEVGKKFDKSDLINIKAHIDKYGVVIVSGVATKDQCEKLILEQWAKTILQQDYTKEFRLEITDANGRVLDPTVKADQPKFLEQVTGPLSKDDLEKFKKGWPKHLGFGAPCDPSVWHTELVWALRQDPDLYKIAVAICEEPRLFVTICRSVNVLPGQGLPELLHWDRNVYKAWLMSFAGAPKEFDEVGIQGKVAYTPSKFICVPFTHTDKFLQAFHSAYGPYYPQLMKNHTKFGLSKDKDPWDLFGQTVELDVGEGDIVIWMREILHGTKPNKNKHINES